MKSQNEELQNAPPNINVSYERAPDGKRILIVLDSEFSIDAPHFVECIEELLDQIIEKVEAPNELPGL